MDLVLANIDLVLELIFCQVDGWRLAVLALAVSFCPEGSQFGSDHLDSA